MSPWHEDLLATMPDVPSGEAVMASDEITRLHARAEELFAKWRAAQNQVDIRQQELDDVRQDMGNQLVEMGNRARTAEALGDAIAAAVEVFGRYRIPTEWGDEWDIVRDAARAWRAAREA